MGEKLAPFATSCYRIRHVEHQTSWESLKWKHVRFHWPFAIDGHLTSAQVLWPLACMAGVKRRRGNLGARGLLPPPRTWSRALFPFPFPFRTPATQAIWPQDEPANIYTVYEPSQRKKTPERPTAWVLFQLSPGMDQTPISIPQRMTSCECLRTSQLEASYSRLLFCRSIDDDENNTKKSCHSWLKLTLAP